MGTWAAGNFDNDSALDFVATVMDNAARELNPPDEVEDIELVMASVAVCKVLVEHCHTFPPKREQIESLKKSVLQIFDADFEKLDPSEGFQETRRAVIVTTFDEFLALLERLEQTP